MVNGIESSTGFGVVRDGIWGQRVGDVYRGDMFVFSEGYQKVVGMRENSGDVDWQKLEAVVH